MTLLLVVWGRHWAQSGAARCFGVAVSLVGVWYDHGTVCGDMFWFFKAFQPRDINDIRRKAQWSGYLAGAWFVPAATSGQLASAFPSQYEGTNLHKDLQKETEMCAGKQVQNASDRIVAAVSLTFLAYPYHHIRFSKSMLTAVFPHQTFCG